MRVARLKEAYPTAKVELWCEDEHRLGLKPIIRKAWSPIGERPIVKVHRRYEWTYLYAFARPKTGEVCWLILPTVNAEAFSMALENFAKEVGAGKRKRILLVLDRAGWHTAKKELRVPEGIHLGFLPSHSPELQPSEERLWPLSNEGVANRHFERIEDLGEALVGRCVALGDQPEVIRSYTRYHWWPEAA
jgi:DDE superfamily endonuclease